MGEKLDKPATTDPRQPGQKVPQYQSNPQDDEVDMDSEDSFPASDPPSYNPGHAGQPKERPKEHKD